MWRLASDVIFSPFFLPLTIEALRSLGLAARTFSHCTIFLALNLVWETGYLIDLELPTALHWLARKPRDLPASPCST